MSEARVEITISVPDDTSPLSIRVMRGGRLVHVFDEPEGNRSEPQSVQKLRREIALQGNRSPEPVSPSAQPAPLQVAA